MPEVRSPTLRRRELGALLRARRLELGLTVDQVAGQLLCSPSKVSRLVEVKVRRHDVLTKESAPQFSVVLDEAVLHRAVGGPGGMRAQLDHLIEASKFHNVTVQVIPYDVGAHPAMDSAFTILEFGDPAPSVIYVEGLMGWLYLERAYEVAKYQEVFDYLHNIALDPKETIAMTSEIGAQYNGAPVRFLDRFLEMRAGVAAKGCLRIFRLNKAASATTAQQQLRYNSTARERAAKS